MYVALYRDATCLFYQAALTGTKGGRQQGETNPPLPIAPPHELCFLVQLLIYSQKQCVDVLFNYIKDMKKFAVLQKIGVFNATVVREFDNKEDAESFRTLMQRSEENERIEYFTIENLSGSDPKCMLAI